MVKPTFVTSRTLQVPALRHGFFTRKGGVCQGLQDGKANDLSAGFSPDADPAHIAENRKRIAHEFGAPFVSARQVHGADVLTVTETWDTQHDPREADGLVTATRHLGLGILTADCGPILFADVEAGVIGACHAGWKGVKAGIIDTTVRAMRALGARPERTIAALGPCMGRASYEVGYDFPDEFQGVLAHHRSYFRPAKSAEKLMFDMPRAIKTKLQEAGVRRPDIMDQDTFVDRDTFFSYRRAAHSGQAAYGRQISLIALK